MFMCIQVIIRQQSDAEKKTHHHGLMIYERILKQTVKDIVTIYM